MNYLVTMACLCVVASALSLAFWLPPAAGEPRSLAVLRTGLLLASMVVVAVVFVHLVR